MPEYLATVPNGPHSETKEFADPARRHKRQFLQESGLTPRQYRRWRKFLARARKLGLVDPVK
jgi:5-bromo-4-chloroindolyl phosphate hydrolysis protein